MDLSFRQMPCSFHLSTCFFLPIEIYCHHSLPIYPFIQVFVLWPDDGTWYRGKVRKCNPEEMTALIYYEDTDEKEQANMQELISEGQIAFSK